MKLIVLGATGLVGSHLLNVALRDSRVEQVFAPVRRAILTHPKLIAPVLDFRNLPEQPDFWKADAVICTLGTTIKKAGSRGAFCFADYELPLAVARLARTSETPVWVLNSAVGACNSSRFAYNRIKARLEQDLGKLDFPSLTLVRPSVIRGERTEFRAGERALIAGLQIISPFIPLRWHPVSAEKIVSTLLNASLAAVPGTSVIESEQIT